VLLQQTLAPSECSASAENLLALLWKTRIDRRTDHRDWQVPVTRVMLSRELRKITLFVANRDGIRRGVLGRHLEQLLDASRCIGTVLGRAVSEEESEYQVRQCTNLSAEV